VPAHLSAGEVRVIGLNYLKQHKARQPAVAPAHSGRGRLGYVDWPARCRGAQGCVSFPAAPWVLRGRVRTLGHVFRPRSGWSERIAALGDPDWEAPG